MSPKAPTPSPEKRPKTTARYHDFNRFVVTYRQTPTDLPYAAIFRRAGKLVGVDLNPPQRDNAASSTPRVARGTALMFEHTHDASDHRVHSSQWPRDAP